MGGKVTLEISRELADKMMELVFSGLSLSELFCKVETSTTMAKHDRKMLLEEIRNYHLFNTPGQEPKSVIIFPLGRFPDDPTVYCLPGQQRIYKATNPNKIFSQFQLFFGNNISVYQQVYGSVNGVSTSYPRVIFAEEFICCPRFEDELLRLKLKYFVENYIYEKTPGFKSYIIGSREIEKVSSHLKDIGLTKTENI